MSYEYDKYLKEHRKNVTKAFKWIVENIPEVIENKEDFEKQICLEHDKSKNQEDEYRAYDKYFYGNKSFDVTQEFNKAWLLHIHRNPHHWQHWILVNDDGGEEILIEMPKIYVIEMICDWWSFSWKKGNLFEIFDWYDERKDIIKLHKKTRVLVWSTLRSIKNKLEEEKLNAK